MMHRDEYDSTENIPVQAKIEAVMQEFFNEGRWESIFLFSSEGLVMASYGHSPGTEQEILLDFNFSLSNIVKLLDENVPIKEVAVRGIAGK